MHSFSFFPVVSSVGNVYEWSTLKLMLHIVGWQASTIITMSPADDANVGRCPWQPLAGSLLCGCGVEDTPMWGGTSGLHGME